MLSKIFFYLRGKLITKIVEQQLLMEQKSKIDLNLINLVNEFESKFEQGNMDYVEEQTIYQLVDYYERENLLEKAMDVVDVALEQFKFRSDFYLMKAKIFYNDNKINDCLEVLTLASKVAPYEKEITLLQIKALCSKKKIEEALTLLNKFDEGITSDRLEYLIAKSYILEVNKDYKAMYYTLQEAIKLDPSNVEALERFWVAVDLSREYEESILFHKNIIDEQPYNHLAWYNLGLSYSFNWEYTKAIESLEYSFIINPEFEQGYIECAELCIQEGLYQKALDIYIEANSKFGPEVDLMINIASCYLKLDKIAEARIILLKALRIDSHNEEVYFYLGESYSKSESWYSAINAYLKAIDIDDCREEYYLSLAKAYAKVEDYNKATINFHRATKVCVEESLYWKEYVCFVLKLGLYKEAEQILDEAEEHTFGADLLYCRAITYFFMKKKKLGLAILEEALEEDFSMHKIIYDLAPELVVDKEINSMIKYYKEEYEDYC
jgi:tetratricopeptide (TPR) repeat protein